MLEAAVIVKALLEVAILALLGQGLLYLLAGKKRDQNIFYQVLRIIASPAMRLTRMIAPRAFPEVWIGAIALSILVSGWLVATYYKICLTINAC